RQNVVIGSGIGNLRTDVNFGAIDDLDGGSIHESVDEGCVRILINLLNAAGELIRRLSPVMVFHRDYKNGFDLLCARICTTNGSQACKHCERQETVSVRHQVPPREDWRQTSELIQITPDDLGHGAPHTNE